MDKNLRSRAKEMKCNNSDDFGVQDGVNGCYPSENKANTGFFSQLIAADQKWTSKWAVCACRTSSYGAFRPIMKLLEYSGHGVPWITIPILFFLTTTDGHLLQLVTNLILAMFFDLAVIAILKGLIKRPRPVNNIDDMFLTVAVDNYSFPSGHCTRASMVAWIYIMILSPTWSLCMVAILWSFCLAMSRVMLGRHHFIDITCGLLIGYLQALTICYFWLPIATCKDIRHYLNLDQ